MHGHENTTMSDRTSRTIPPEHAVPLKRALGLRVKLGFLEADHRRAALAQYSLQILQA